MVVVDGAVVVDTSAVVAGAAVVEVAAVVDGAAVVGASVEAGAAVVDGAAVVPGAAVVVVPACCSNCLTLACAQLQLAVVVPSASFSESGLVGSPSWHFFHSSTGS